jgi:hypothetical protein
MPEKGFVNKHERKYLEKESVFDLLPLTLACTYAA